MYMQTLTSWKWRRRHPRRFFALLPADDFYEDSVREFAVDQVDDAIFHESFESLWSAPDGRVRFTVRRTE